MSKKNYKAVVSANIKRLRREKELTQKSAVKGVSQQEWSRWEKKTNNPTLGTLERIAGLLGVDVLDLFGVGNSENAVLGSAIPHPGFTEFWHDDAGTKVFISANSSEAGYARGIAFLTEMMARCKSFWFNGYPIRRTHLELVITLSAECRAEYERSPECLRARRDSLVDRIAGCVDEAARTRTRNFHRHDTGEGMGRNEWDEKAEAARKALVEFDAEHPEVKGAIEAEERRALESFRNSN